MKFEITEEAAELTETERLDKENTLKELKLLHAQDRERTIILRSISEVTTDKELFSWTGPVWFVVNTFLAMDKLNQLRESAQGFIGDFVEPIREDSDNPTLAYKEAVKKVSEALSAASVDLGFSRKIRP